MSHDPSMGMGLPVGSSGVSVHRGGEVSGVPVVGDGREGSKYCKSGSARPDVAPEGDKRIRGSEDVEKTSDWRKVYQKGSWSGKG